LIYVIGAVARRFFAINFAAAEAGRKANLKIKKPFNLFGRLISPA